MKIKIILALLFSTLCNAQITLNDMKTILKMDYDSFETFVMNKGFIFYSREKDDFDSVFYTKGLGENTKYIALYTRRFNNYLKRVNYQTGSEAEYLSIKKQMKEQGFYFFDTYESKDEKQFSKTYRNKIYELRVHSISNKYNTVTYEIGFDFIEK